MPTGLCVPFVCAEDFMRIASGFWFLLLLFGAYGAAAAKPAPKQAAPGYCKTFKGEFVGFGEQTTRGDAEKALDREIAAWEQRSGLKAAQSAGKYEWWKVTCRPSAARSACSCAVSGMNR